MCVDTAREEGVERRVWRSLTCCWRRLGLVLNGDCVLTEQELDPGFGAPRHLLCGAVDAHVTYILRARPALAE